MRQKQAPFRVEDDIERGDITMATAATEDFHRESGDGLCGDFSCPHCAFSVDQDVMLKVLKHFFNCTSLQYIIDLSVGNAANLGGPKPSPAPRRASKAPQPHSEPSHRHVEPPAKRRATEARATPPQETPRIVTTQAPTLLARLNAAQSRTQSVQSVGQREIPSEPEHRTVTTRHVDTVQPRAIETTTTTTAEIELPSIPTIKEEPGDTGASCVVEPTPPTLFDEPMHTQKETDSGMGVKRDSDNVGGILDTLPGTSSSGLFSEDLNFGGAGPSFPQTEPPQDDSSSGNADNTRLDPSSPKQPYRRPVSLKGASIGGVLHGRRRHLQVHLDRGSMPAQLNIIPEAGKEHVPRKIPGREKVCKWCSLQKKKQAVRGRTSETTFACSVCHVRLHPKTCFDSYHQWALSQSTDSGFPAGERALTSNPGDNGSSDEEESPQRMYVETEVLEEVELTGSNILSPLITPNQLETSSLGEVYSTGEQGSKVMMWQVSSPD